MTHSNARELLKLHEAQAVRRLKAGSAQARDVPTVATQGPVSWVKNHPLASLSAAAGLGFFAAPGGRGSAKRSRDPESSAAAAATTHAANAGRVLVYARLARSLASWFRPVVSTVPRGASAVQGSGPESAHT